MRDVSLRPEAAAGGGRGLVDVRRDPLAADPGSDIPALVCAPNLAWPCAQAVAIELCESGGDPAAVSPDGEYWGLFQLSRRWHEWRFIRRGWSWVDALDPAKNIAIAAEIYDDAGWAPWSCRN